MAGTADSERNDGSAEDRGGRRPGRPRERSVWQALQRGVDRGELRPDADFTLIYNLLLGPLFMRSVVRGEPLEPAMAEQTVDLVLAAFGNDTTGRQRRDSSPPRRPQP